MSITSALSNAISGLQMNARGTETVANNLANVMTPGYARREMSLSAQAHTGGVRVNSIERIVTTGLLAEARTANASETNGLIQAKFLTEASSLIGITGEAGSLGSAVADLHASLVSAATRPDDQARLSVVVSNAMSLTRKLNVIGDSIQNARSAADAQISGDVDSLNAGLKLVSSLNERIANFAGDSTSAASLYDQRQTVIDQISQIVPVQEVARSGGKVALFTTNGAMLLDGFDPVTITFTPIGTLSAGMTVGSPPVAGLTVGGKELPAERLSLFAGGSLAANFAVRDQLAPQLQREVDAIALDLHDRFANPAVDTTLSLGAPGLFTDGGSLATTADINGLSSRLQLNDAIQVSDPWRLRSGLGATTSGPAGDGALLNALADVLKLSGAMQDATSFSGKASFDGFIGQLEARSSTRRITQDAEVAASSARSVTLTTKLLSEGVDTDAEMSRLLQYEQAYSANAKVIQTINEMMDTILRMS